MADVSEITRRPLVLPCLVTRASVMYSYVVGAPASSKRHGVLKSGPPPHATVSSYPYLAGGAGSGDLTRRHGFRELTRFAIVIYGHPALREGITAPRPRGVSLGSALPT